MRRSRSRAILVGTISCSWRRRTSCRFSRRLILRREFRLANARSWWTARATFAARLFQNWMHSGEAQQILVAHPRQYSPHSQTVEKPGVRRLADIKLMKEDSEGVLAQADAVKRRYAEIFKV